MSIRDKSSASALREKYLKQGEEKKKSKGGDKRFLNYYDLDFGEKMTIRLLPDGGDSGETWLEYSTHGTNLKLRGANSIACSYISSGEDCPACAHSWDYHEDNNKDEAYRWRRKETFISQCLVIDSNIEINETDDENPVKLVYLPFGIIDVIKEAITENKIGEIIDHDFIIKKSKGKNGYANYDKSYFDTTSNELDKEILSAFDDGDLKLFDLSEELPKNSTTEEVDTWLSETIELDNKNSRRKNSRGNNSGGNAGSESGDDGDDDKKESGASKSEGTTKVKGSALVNRLKNKQKG